MPEIADSQVSELLRAEARGLVSFITMLTGDRERADDIFQETCLEVWRARHRFVPGRDFGSWVRGVARNLVLRTRRREGRDRTSPFGPEVMERLATTWEEQVTEDVMTARRAALEECLEALPSEKRQVLRRLYSDHASHDTLAAELGRTRDAVKMLAHRLRRKLMECVKGKLRQEAWDAE